MKLFNIYIITDAPIPIGMAPTNRILSYANGFVANSVDCEIIIFRKTENTERTSNLHCEGVLDGFKFRYLFKSTVKSNYFFKRRIDIFLGAVRLFWFSLFMIKSNSTIIYYSSHTYAIIILRLAKLLNSIILLKEESEHPDVYINIQKSINRFFFTKMHYKLFDGYLLMTQALIDHFNRIYPNKPNTHIPMTVDLIRFSVNKNIDINSLTYIGYLNDKKDGINILIEAFSKITNQFPEYYLSLYGDVAENKNLDNYIKLSEELNIPKSKIIFKSSVHNSQIPQILSESKLLLLARPNSKQANNGFPTKLGEYLASGTPVVVTSVGEISQYLQDGVSAFIAKPNDASSFASKMEEALKNYDNAIQIGMQGRIVAEVHFNNIVQTKKIMNFIEQF